MSLVSRRGFLASASVLGGVAALGCLGCAPQTTEADAADSLASTGESTSTWWSDSLGITDADCVGTAEVDILVVGAGCSGVPAAMAAAEKGAKVMLIEQGETGVAVRTSGIAACSSRYQKAYGISLNHEEALNDIMTQSLGYGDLRKWKVWTDNCDEAINWYGGILESFGFTFDVEAEMPAYETRHPYWASGHSPRLADDFNADISEQDILKGCLDYFASYGGEYRNQCPLQELIVENGKVVGAYVGRDGSYERINATKGVIVATGGYVNNPEIFLERQGQLAQSIGGTLNFGTAAGDGLKAMMRVGAQMEDVATTMVFDRVIIPVETDMEALEFNGASDFEYFVFSTQPFLKVGKDGKRLGNESTPYDFIPHVANQQQDHTWYPVWDSTWKEDVERFHTCGCSTIGNHKPGRQMQPSMDDIDAQMQMLVEKGYVFQCDTLEELAEKLDLNVENFIEETANYNAMFKAGADTQYGKEFFRMSGLDTPPYYGMRASGSALCTLDGVKCLATGEVVDGENKPIPGLYVLGNDAGGHYAHTYPNHFNGLNAGRCVTTGYVLGRRLAQ